WSYVLHDASASGGPVVSVSQADVRAIQLAKAALHAGAQLLMDKMGVVELDRIILAGAFGAHISPKHAMILGMIPDCDVDNVTSAGNAAGTGAMIALLNSAARREIEHIVRTVEKIETAIEPKFQDHFVAANKVPHDTQPYTKLREVASWPDFDEVPAAAEAGGRRRRRRR
ncbi:MAG: ASKHA domain-containing protein, partial [Pseudomonadota bacterium]